MKLRLCPGCSDKLNYRSKKREIKRLKRSTKKKSQKEEIDRGNSSSNYNQDLSETVSTPAHKTSAKVIDKKPEEKRDKIIVDEAHWTKGMY